MELRSYCAYNQTRECFLGLEVTAGDFSYKALSLDRALVLKPNEGLWLKPYRGIPDSGAADSLDLIYLDRECRVIDLVESFPARRISSSRPAADSLLVVPAHSIFSSDTQAGDQFVLCVAEEMPRRLEGFSDKQADDKATSAALPASLWAAAARWSESSQIGPSSKPESGTPESESEQPLIQPGPHKSWWQRWWSPDRRKTNRQLTSRLAAYFWNGARPTANPIRDVSPTGMYLLTDERWYPGTLVLMTLQDTKDIQKNPDGVLAVKVRAVRWGNDGVGLQFVGPEDENGELFEGANKKQLAEFLRRMTDSNPE
jgi:hypothetical protein